MKKFLVRSIKRRKLYTTKEAAKEIRVCEATIHRMVCQGLPVLDKDSRPFLILGLHLQEFVKKKNEKYKVQLKPEEFLCVKCRQAVLSIPENFEIIMTQRIIGPSRQVLLKGQCMNCHTKLNRYSSERTIIDLISRGVINQNHMRVLIDTTKT